MGWVGANWFDTAVEKWKGAVSSEQRVMSRKTKEEDGAATLSAWSRVSLSPRDQG